MLPGLVVVLAYLIGSIPFSFLVVKLVAGKDVREHGSQNVGATNVARTAGKIPGIIALLLDIAKGYCAVVISWTIVRSAAWPFEAGIRPWESVAMWTALAGLIAVLGHMFPVWLRFHGGKGVATATGVFLALDPIAVAGALIVFAIVLIASRYVSLASILSSASIPLFFHYLLNEPFWYVVISIGISITVILKHHSNIARLVEGTERKLGQKKESQ